ncbi:MAG: hypothetical protein ACFFDT_26885 [Candidatus Hodarchaeota archaeon]
MDTEALKEAALNIFNAIFSNQDEVELEGRLYPIHQTKSGLRNVTYSGIWFIEQNPHKDSHHAHMAREGHKILWGIKKRTYVLRVIDGNFIFLKKIK